MLKRDNNELIFNALLFLEKRGNPEYYAQLFRYTKYLFNGLNRSDLITELDKLIYENIERKLGIKINVALLIYKQMDNPYRFTRSRVIGQESKDIKKYELEVWFDLIDDWIRKNISSLQSEIIFTLPPKQYF